MSRPPPQLPAEVWIHIFLHLSVSDKFRLRESCKYFKRLVDHAALWKGWTVVLTFKHGSYNSEFWSCLRRRKVRSAVVRSGKAKDWERLSQSLPGLSTVVLELKSRASLYPLKGFSQLKRLAVRNSGRMVAVLTDDSPAWQGQQLTHLSLCSVEFVKASMVAMTEFTNLTSLCCHHTLMEGDTFYMIHRLITHLPKLKHLSVSVTPAFRRDPMSGPRLSEWTHRQTTTADLSSLELIDCWDISFPPDVMALMPSLSSLAVFYKNSLFEDCQLHRWLPGFPKLSTLAVVRGPLVKMFVNSIPETVTSLTLCMSKPQPEDLTAIAQQVPNLLHLHVDPWPWNLGAHTADIPQRFPKLKSLTLRHKHVPEENFLSLHQLQDLERLEILDSHPRLSELICKLRALTRHRLCITISSPTDVLSCPCVWL